MPSERIIQEVVLEGEKDVVAALLRIGKVGDQAFGTLATGVRQVDTSKLQDNLEKVGKAGEGIASRLRDAFKNIKFDGRDLADPLGAIRKAGSQALTAIGNAGGAVGEFARKAGVAGGVVAGLAAGMFTLAKSFSSAASAISEGATAAGTSVENFQKMRFAAQQSGSSAEAMQRAYAQISSAAGEAISKGERSAGTFEKLGIDLVDAAGNARDSTAVFLDVADAVAAIADPAQRAAAAAYVFGRRLGPGLTELLGQGRAGILALGAEAERLGIVMPAASVKIGKAFGDSFNKLSSVIGAVKNAMGEAFAPGFIVIMDQLAQAIGKHRDIFIGLARAIADILMPLLRGIATVITDLILPALQTLKAAFDGVATDINAVFGTSLTGMDILVGALLAKWLAGFAGLAAVIGAIGPAVSGLIGTIGGLAMAVGQFGAAVAAAVVASPWIAVAIAIAGLLLALGYLAYQYWPQIAAGAQAAWQAIGEGAASVGQSLSGVWQSIASAAQSTWAAIGDGALSMWQGIVSLWDTGVSSLGSAWDTLKSAAQQAFQTVIDWATRAANAVASAFGASEGLAGGGGVFLELARGGAVRGPGGPTSDSVPAWLSSGEFVMRAAAVRKYGLGLMGAINRLDLPEFALGGLVESLQVLMPQPPRFAEGGAVTGGPTRVLNLTIGGETFAGLIAPEIVAQKLTRVATKSQIRSAGRKPSWVR